MTEQNLQVVLASRPQGAAAEANFSLVEAPIPSPGDGQVLVRNRWLSIDPYMFGRMLDVRSYAEPVALGQVMVGDTAGEVVESRHPAFCPGDAVAGYLGWQRYGVDDGKSLRKVPTAMVPLSAHLGAAGMPGVTAYVGMMDICAPRPGQTVVVTAASGAVGSVAGQLAKLRDCTVIGIAGGAAKCDYVVRELGFDHCLDYRAEDFKPRLKAVLGKGVDCIFDNVGGEVLEALVNRLNPHARIALCGAIAEINNPEPRSLRRVLPLIVNRARVQGFIVGDHQERWPAITAELVSLIAQGRLKYRESVAEGLEAAPGALVGLFQGRNFGKQLVRL